MSEKLILEKSIDSIEVKEQNFSLNPKKVVYSFLFIVVFSVYLRLPGIYFGLPYVLHPEESNNLLQILTVCKNIFKVQCFNSSFLYLFFNAIVVFISSLTLNIHSLLNTLEINPGTLYVPLRFLSLFFGIGSIVTLYFIGLRFSLLTGILASGFLAVSLIHVKLSQLFLPFSAMTFFSLLSMFLAIKNLSNTTKLNLFPSTMCALVSTLANYLGIVSIVPIIIVQVLRKDFSKLKGLLKAFFTLFIIFNPQLIFNLFGFMKFLASSYLNGYYDYHSSSYLLTLFKYLTIGVGPIVCFSALIYLFNKNNHANDQDLIKILFSLPLIYFSVLGFFHLVDVGYTLMLAPYFCLGAGLFFNTLNKQIEKQFLFIVLLLFAFYIPLKYTLKYNKIMSLADTRIIATEWINDNASGNITIARDKNSIQFNWFDPYSKESLKNLGADPDMLIGKKQFIISSKLLAKENWFKILRKKVDYVVLNSFDAEKVLRSPGNNIEKKYYLKILKLKPLITINPYLKEYEKQTGSSLIEDLYSPYLTLWQRERSGPLIKIYKL